MKVLLSLMASLFLTICCSSRPEPKILIGKYSFSAAPNQDSLFLNTNNTYKHKFSTGNGQIFEASGVWEYDSINQEILFKDFVFFNNSGSSELPPGNWYSKVNLTNNGEVRLMYSSEDNVYYLKR